MSAPQQQKPQSSLLAHVLLAGASAWVLSEIAPATTSTPLDDMPAFMEGQILHPWPTLAATVCAVNSVMATSRACAGLAGWLEYRSTLIVRNYKASARFALFKDIQDQIFRWGWSPYFGVYAGKGRRHRGKPIFTDFSSNAAFFGTSGSGKGVGSVVPNIMALGNAGHSMLVLDFKPNLAAMTKAHLESIGYAVHVVNIGGLQTHILGETASYGLLQIIIDDFKRIGGLADLDTDTNELALQLYPEPESAQGDSMFWIQGSHEYMEVAFIQAVLVHGEDATLADARSLIINRENLLKEMLWVAGGLEDQEGNPVPTMPLEHAEILIHQPEHEKQAFLDDYRARAGEIAQQLQSDGKSNQAQSFLKGAYNALKPFSKNSRSYAALATSSFRFSDMKDGGRPVAVFLTMDSSRMGQGDKIMGALQWAALTEWKRHENKHVPVYVVGDECTNAKVHNLPSLMTWGREFNIRLMLYIQSIGAFRKVYGKEAVNTLLSEAEILTFLPNQRDPEMLGLIEKLLGQMAYVGRNSNAAFHGFNMQGQTVSEDIRPLMTQEEIRKTDKAILFIRNCLPVLTTLPSYASIDPWRDQVGNNPFYNEPYRKRVTLRLEKRRAPFLVRLRWFLTRGRI